PAGRVAHYAGGSLLVSVASDLPHSELRLPRLAAEIVEISIVVAGLVIVAVVPALEVLIQRCVELLRPTHQRHQPRNIVEHGIRVDPLIALGPAILRARPGAVGVSSLHEPARRVVEITVVARATDEEPEILVPAERLGDLRDR